MLSGLSWPAVALLLAAGVALDLLLGEARRFHPLVGFGNVASALERRLNNGGGRLLRGAAGWILAVLPLTALAMWLCGVAGVLAHAALLYFCIGLRSLRDHNLPIANALCRGDLPAARELTGRIVSRDTVDANEADLAKASAESLLENGNDAVFGTLFWFAVAGGPGALLFRLANTLDAMWGYRNARFLYFGRVAARIDDALNYIPARLTALSYVLLAPGAAGRRMAWRCWREQAPAWSSPNAGPVMSSGAGALGLALGGAARYDGEIEQRPPLGRGMPATAADIERAWRLVWRTTLLWLAVSWLGAATVMALGVRHA
ncbi:CobD/CbiB family cobalamin biosynthesis protein [Pseudoduganella albidiflava]|uniref:Cobalamin biosynthesis protein CobD n=1 Tax=Pseudoduganella albidiflava TaxID=321983 RepID=A0ABX5S118_9BURK|nr:CobD/CbiB family cobalamin biosynthesis protein [Pseudoduganella albidiflava]QBI03709.1 cobalamin biosynthesis protein [Pseudoduganella albidiflava]